MKHSLATLALLGAVVLPASPAAAAACDVTVGPAFTPAAHTVAKGATVTWCWAESGHSVRGSFGDSGVRPSGATFAHTFTTAGTFSYACAVHPSTMTGQIVVQQASASPSPSTSPTPKQTTKAPTPTPVRTTTAPTTRAQASTTPAVIPTSDPPSPTTTPSAAPTSATPTASATTAAPSPTESQAPLDIDPAPAKPNTGLAIALGLVVAAGAFGGAGWLLLRGRSA